MSASNDRLAGLGARPKTVSAEELGKVDRVGEARGFSDRSPRRKPGRKASPRTHRLHPKLLPAIGEEIAAEAGRPGITQGQARGADVGAVPARGAGTPPAIAALPVYFR